MASESLARKMTPTAAVRALMGPYRDKMERSDAARGKLEGRLRRAFDLYDAEMRDIWGEVAAESEAASANEETA